MKHLFIINPIAEQNKSQTQSLIKEIHSFFMNNPKITYNVYITGWKRDATGFIRKYSSDANEIVRVYAIGGTGTLFEAVNGVIGLPNVQVAFLPTGKNNSFAHFFGNDKMHLFSSLRNLVFADVTAIDTIRCGNNYGVSYGAVGLEALAKRTGGRILSSFDLPIDLSYTGAGLYHLMKMKNLAQHYDLKLDDQDLSGEYLSILIANQPYYGYNMKPAIDAFPNDGIMDVYLIKKASKLRYLQAMPKYIKGKYREYPNLVYHYTGKKLTISSEEMMCICVDGEIFYDTSVQYEIIPYSLDFICPKGIDMDAVLKMQAKEQIV